MLNSKLSPIKQSTAISAIQVSCRGATICLLATAFLLYEFILQVSPSVMTHQLMGDLGLDAAGLGAMAAFYYYAYAPMQLPAGLLFDRFGPRRLLTLATLACALGALSFGLAGGASLAAAGRLLMGIGSAFAFIGALLLVSQWFPPAYFAILAGTVQLAACLGAIFGQIPLAAAILRWGWRETVIGLGVCGLWLALFIWCLVRDRPENPLATEQTLVRTPACTELQRLKEVLGNSQTGLIALYAFCVWAPVVAFAALWGIPFLVAGWQLSTQAASSACAMLWLGIGIGSPLLGAWSDRVGRRCLPLTASAALGVLSLSMVIYYPSLPLGWLYVGLFLTGLAASGQVLAFGVVKDNNRPEVAGTAIGLNNMAVVAGGALFQPLIGGLLIWGASSVVHYTTAYTVDEYRTAFLVLPLCYLLAACISGFWLRETHCQLLNPVKNNFKEAEA